MTNPTEMNDNVERRDRPFIELFSLASQSLQRCESNEVGEIVIPFGTYLLGEPLPLDAPVISQPVNACGDSVSL